MGHLTIPKNIRLSEMSPDRVEELLNSEAAKNGQIKGLDVFIKNLAENYDGSISKGERAAKEDPFFNSSKKTFFWEDDFRGARILKRQARKNPGGIKLKMC